jgi:hypothetical protein
MANSEFRWHGGRLSVNFTATLGMRWGPVTERLSEPADLARWFREAGMTGEDVAVSATNLTEARDLREALYRLFTGAGTDVAEVNRWIARPVAGGLLAVSSGALVRLPPAPASASTLTTIDVHFVPIRSSSLRVGQAGSKRSPRVPWGEGVTWSSPPVRKVPSWPGRTGYLGSSGNQW